MSVPSKDFDIFILGSGPAGLQAALHAARAKVRVAVLGRVQKSSLYRAHVENYCCLQTSVTGKELLEQGQKQAEHAGAVFIEADVTDLDPAGDGGFRLTLDDGQALSAHAVILAMGVSRTRLNVPGEKEYLGRGVSYCVDCDGLFFRNQRVVIVGNESAAASGALQLLLSASAVHHVFGELAVSDHLRTQIERSAVVTHGGRKVAEIAGGPQGVTDVVLDDGARIPCEGVFIELGAKGALELATKLGVALDSETMKYVATTRRQETNIPGVYAAGDICGPPWQVAKAVGEGCVAGLEAASYAKKRRG